QSTRSTDRAAEPFLYLGFLSRGGGEACGPGGLLVSVACCRGVPESRPQRLLALRGQIAAGSISRSANDPRRHRTFFCSKTGGRPSGRFHRIAVSFAIPA